MADRRRRDAEARCGTGHAAFDGQSVEDAQQIEIEQAKRNVGFQHQNLAAPAMAWTSLSTEACNSLRCPDDAVAAKTQVAKNRHIRRTPSRGHRSAPRQPLESASQDRCRSIRAAAPFN